MRIRQLTAYHVCLPLRRPFLHATAVRHASDNLVVRCELADGTAGWGEGVPRDYVTGETIRSCFEQLDQTPLAGQLSNDCATWEEVIELCDALQPSALDDDPRGCRTNSVRAAVELGILDAFGKLFAEPVCAVTQFYSPAEPIRTNLESVRYSTAIDGDSRGLRMTALTMRLYGFRQCKVKVGAGGDDAQRLRTIRRWIGLDVDLRADANAAWLPDEAERAIERIQPAGISCIEQPCPHEALTEMHELRRRAAVPIMLDESVTSRADAEAAIRLAACDLFNIRLAKCGGFLASLRLARLAHDAGIAYQLGCHPGESGILSAAGRHWATSVKGIRYWEGSYDRHLLGCQLTREDVTFGYGGHAPRLAGPGLGVTIDRQALERIVQRKKMFEISA